MKTSNLFRLFLLSLSQLFFNESCHDNEKYEIPKGSYTNEYVLQAAERRKIN